MFCQRSPTNRESVATAAAARLDVEQRPMLAGVPREIKPQEHRVRITPQSVRACGPARFYPPACI